MDSDPIWRRLHEVGPELGVDWRPVRSARSDLEPPPEPAVPGEAEIVEQGGDFRIHKVGPPAQSRFQFFLDGIEQTRVSGYVGMIPIVHGYVAAVIRRRADRSFRTWAVLEEEVLAFPFEHLSPQRLIGLGFPENVLLDSSKESDPLHPIRLAENGRVAIKRRRSRIEAQLARRWVRSSGGHGWLLVDGGLAIDRSLAACGRAVGLVKSHRTQFLNPELMYRVLGMRAGERSSVFKPIRPEVGEVYSWYLRLRSAQGQDIYWALARIEASANSATLAQADEVSRWLLNETAPLSLPDTRWHVLLYPIRDCEAYLRARKPTLALS